MEIVRGFACQKDSIHGLGFRVEGYGLNLGWGGPIEHYIGFWGNLLRDTLQI